MMNGASVKCAKRQTAYMDVSLLYKADHRVKCSHAFYEVKNKCARSKSFLMNAESSKWTVMCYIFYLRVVFASKIEKLHNL